MSNLRRAYVASLAVAFALAAGFGAPALATDMQTDPGHEPDGVALLAPPPKPTHKPKPTPTPTPAVTPAPTGPSRTPRPTAAPTPRITPRPTTATSTPKPKPKAAQSATPAMSPEYEGMAPGPGFATPASAAGAGAVRSTGPQPIAMAAALAFLVGVTFFGGWFVVGRRRRSGAGGGPLIPQAAFASAGAPPEPRATVRSHVPEDEANMPRWLRPSVRQERAWTPPVRHEAFREARRLSRFEDPASDGVMRQSLRYDGALLLNVPSDTYATPITEMGTGDEVEVLEVSDEWVRVRTPWGDEGWILAMALGAPRPEAAQPEGRRSRL